VIVLAFDPGSRYTGLVVREREDLLAWRLVVRQGNGRLPDGRYVRSVLAEALAALRDAAVDPSDRSRYVVGVEGLAWWPEQDGKRRNQTGLYGTAIILGGILARWPNAVMVDSGRGVANLHPSAYPEPIRPPVNGKGKDRLNHVRAAWDHSHATETEAKIAAREVTL
jgi:hypothetical protein